MRLKGSAVLAILAMNAYSEEPQKPDLYSELITPMEATPAKTPDANPNLSSYIVDDVIPGYGISSSKHYRPKSAAEALYHKAKSYLGKIETKILSGELVLQTSKIIYPVDKNGNKIKDAMPIVQTIPFSEVEEIKALNTLSQEMIALRNKIKYPNYYEKQHFENTIISLSKALQLLRTGLPEEKLLDLERQYNVWLPKYTAAITHQKAKNVKKLISSGLSERQAKREVQSNEVIVEKTPNLPTMQEVKTYEEDLETKQKEAAEEVLAEQKLNKIKRGEKGKGRSVVKKVKTSKELIAEDLEKIEASFNKFEWKKVRKTYSQFLELDATNEEKFKAAEFARKSKLLEKFMKKLSSQRDGMFRNVETNPALVKIIDTKGREKFYAPIDSVGTKNIITDKNAVEYIEEKIAEGEEKIAVMSTKGFATEIETIKISEVLPVDNKEKTTQLSSALNDKTTSLQEGDSSEDPIALYNIAAIAYQNRIDALVIPLLDKAMEIDPALDVTIRDNNAFEYYERMIVAMEKGNKQAAGNIKLKLSKEYNDTSIYAQAEAYYSGKASQAGAIAKKAAADKKQAKRKYLEEKKAVAEKYDAKDVVAKIAEKETAIKEEEIAVANVSGDEAEADALYQKGHDFYAEAVLLGNTLERDSLYKKAIKEFQKARSIYFKIADDRPDDEALGVKMIRNNRELHAAQKQKRP